MSEMVERVARALAAAYSDALGAKTQIVAEDYEAARAAIAAMREPTEGMLDAFYDEPCWGDGPEARDTWRAMIDRAMKDE